MADLTKATWGEDSMKGVGLVVSVYDNSHFNKNGKTGQYIIPFIHPDDPRAVGQNVPELRNELDSQGKYQKQMSFYDSQIEELKKNSESFPLTTKDGDVVGTNYVTRADIMVKGRHPNSFLMPNSTTFQIDPSLSAEPEVMVRTWEMRTEAAAAKKAAKEAKEAKEAKDAPAAAVDDKKAARSAAAKKAAATRKANKEAVAVEASVDEPGLG